MTKGQPVIRSFFRFRRSFGPVVPVAIIHVAGRVNLSLLLKQAQPGVLFHFDHDPAVVSFFTSLLHRSQQPDPAGRAVRGLCRRLGSGDLDGAAAAASGLA